MQIVIDIDEDTYKDIKRGKIYTSVRDVPQESVVAIANGKPLLNIVDVTEKGIIPQEVFDRDRWYCKDYDDLDFSDGRRKDSCYQCDPEQSGRIRRKRMGEIRKHYRAAIIGVLFDKKYEFEDILLLGIAETPESAFAIQHNEIMRLYEDFGEEDDKPAIEYSESRSDYDEPICVIKYAEGYEHIYCMFKEEEK